MLDSNGAGSGNGVGYVLYNLNYLTNLKVLVCDELAKYPIQNNDPNGVTFAPNSFIYPTALTAGGIIDRSAQTGTTSWPKLSSVKTPSQTFAMMDTYETWSGYPQLVEWRNPIELHVPIGFSILYAVHGLGVNNLYVDGHGAWFNLTTYNSSWSNTDYVLWGINKW